MKSDDVLILARGEIKKALVSLHTIEKLLEDALKEIEAAKQEQGKERKRWGRKK